MFSSYYSYTLADMRRIVERIRAKVHAGGAAPVDSRRDFTIILDPCTLNNLVAYLQQQLPSLLGQEQAQIILLPVLEEDCMHWRLLRIQVANIEAKQLLVVTQDPLGPHNWQAYHLAIREAARSWDF